VPSWQADTPANTAIEILLRAECEGRWTKWYHLGWWSNDAERRHSVEKQADADGEVATDTLMLKQLAQGLEWRVVLHGANGQAPTLRTMAVAIGPVPEGESNVRTGAVGPLPVPELSQMAYPDHGWKWCSPTVLNMMLAYWYVQTNNPRLAPFTDPEAVPKIIVPAVYDPVYDGTGNWPFNTAFAANFGLEGYILQLRGLDDLRQLLAAQVPVALSIRWERDQLDDAPIVRSAGHLTLAVGFTQDGDVIVNEPRADSRQGMLIRRTYKRDQLLAAWEGSGRTVYLVYPPGWVS
jgi:hypothetical protein